MVNVYDLKIPLFDTWIARGWTNHQLCGKQPKIIAGDQAIGIKANR